jgi:PAS domain S-box-containing protein
MLLLLASAEAGWPVWAAAAGAGAALAAALFCCIWRCGRKEIVDRERHLAAVLRSIGDGVIVCDSEGRVTSLNLVAEQLCGWKAEDAFGRPLEEIFRIRNAQTGDPAPNPAFRVLREGTVAGLANDTLLVNRDGREIPIADSCAPILSAGGKVVGAVLVFRDVSRLYEQQKQLEDSERRYRLLSEHALAAIAVHRLVRDADGRAVDTVMLNVNARFETETGIRREYVLGRRFSQWYPYDRERQRWLERLSEVERTSRPMMVEEYLPAIGRYMLVQLWKVSPGIVGVALNDLTRLHRAEARAGRLGRLLEASNNEVYIFDAETLRFEEASRSALEQLGYGMEELRQLTPIDLKPALDRAGFEKLLEPLRLGQQPWVKFRTVHRRKDGSTYPVSVRLELLEEDNRHLFLAVIEDQTEQQEAERRLRIEQQRFRAIVEAARDGIILLDADFRIVHCNPEAEALLMCPAQQASGRRLDEFLIPAFLIPAEESASVSSRASLDSSKGHPWAPGLLHAAYIATNGTPRIPVEVSLAPMGDDRGLQYVAIVRDVSRQWQAMQALQASETWHRALFEQSAVGIVVVDPDSGRLRDANRALQRMLAIERADVDSLTLDDLAAAAPGDSPSAARGLCELARRAMAEGSAETEAELRTWTGAPLWCAVSLTKVDLGGAPQLLCALLDITPRKVAEQRLAEQMRQLEQARQGEQLKAAQLEATLAELERQRQQAEQASRAKSDFLAKMSHEMRTPLNAILGMAQLLRERLQQGEPLEQAEMIISSARNLLQLIEELLDLSSIEAGRMRLQVEPFDVDELLDSVFAESSLMARHKQLELLAWAEPAVPRRLSGDFRRLRQVLLNLASNAIKYTDSGQVRICLSWQPSPEAAGRGELILRVEDTGPGIPVDKIPLVFEKFTQLGAPDRQRGGVGLGLAIVRELVSRMGGDVTVASVVGQGATFTVTVPLEAAPEADESAAAVPAPFAPRQACVLSADAARRQCLAALLRRMGVEVFEADLFARLAGEARTRLAPRRAAAFFWSDEYSPEDAQNCAGILTGPSTPEMTVFLIGRKTPVGAAKPGVVALPAMLSPATLRAALVQAAQPSAEEVTREKAHLRPPAATARLRPRILVAEDNPLNQRVAVGLLSRLGYECDTVANGQQAIEAARTGRYQLVLLDVSMPDIDGLEVARRIRAHERATGAARLLLVAVTAHAYPEDRRRCLEAGMDDFLPKPVSLDALSSMLSRWLPVGGTTEGRMEDSYERPEEDPSHGQTSPPHSEP